MPLIRTDRNAIFLATAMASAFIFFCTRNYVLVLPDAMRTWDRLVVWCMAGGLLYTTLFLAGHFALRRFGIGGRGAYAGLGAAACVLTFSALGLFGELITAFQRGSGLSYLIAPAALGAVFGFLYAHRAGWETTGDDPAALSDALAARTAAVAGHPQTDPALVRTAGADYYDGPMQVRTVIPLMLLSAVFATILAGLLRGVMLVGHEVSLVSDEGAARMIEHALETTPAAGIELLFLLVAGVLPMTIVILGGHYIARGLKKTSPVAYFVIGLILPPVLAVVSMLLFTLIALMITLPTAVAMVIYNRLAGLEPVPVKDDVIVNDSRHLVSAEHPRRQFGRIIRSR